MGDQVVANFGFGIFQLFGVLLGVVVGWFLDYLVHFRCISWRFLAVMSVAIIYTLEGIYKAALYEFALGEKPLEFQQEDLRTAYQRKVASAF